MGFLTMLGKLTQDLHAGCSHILILVIKLADDRGDHIMSHGIVLPQFHCGAMSFCMLVENQTVLP